MRRALVTGGTAGVGRSIVGGLVASGARVDVIGTNPARGRALEPVIGPAGGRFIALDLGDLDATRRFAAAYAAEREPLDVLVCAAGVLLPCRQETAAGHERTLAVGYLSAAVLAPALRARLAAARRGRVVLVSGSPGPVLRRRLDLDDLQLRAGYSLRRAALNAVHAKTVLAQILAARFAADGVDVNAVHPGGVKSELFRHLPGPLRLVGRGVRAFMDDESRAGIRAAVAPELDGVTGQLLVDATARPLTFPAAYRDRLWAETAACLADGGADSEDLPRRAGR